MIIVILDNNFGKYTKKNFPMGILSQVAKAMQGILTETAGLIAYKTGFIKRLST